MIVNDNNNLLMLIVCERCPHIERLHVELWYILRCSHVERWYVYWGARMLNVGMYWGARMLNVGMYIEVLACWTLVCIEVLACWALKMFANACTPFVHHHLPNVYPLPLNTNSEHNTLQYPYMASRKLGRYLLRFNPLRDRDCFIIIFILK